jgi:hypothetical protein
MKAFVAFALMSVIVLGWIAGPEPSALLLTGSALIGIGILARRTRQTRKEHV